MADASTIRSGNLFDYATSELSQDAFVCWLCSRWGDPDDTVRAASQNLLHAMLGSDDPTPVRVPRVARQRCHVDVALLTEHAGVRRIVIVEDKTGSVDHDDQLRRYPERADDLFPGEPYDGVRVVYYKTGPLVEYARIADQCDTILGLEDIVPLIVTTGVGSPNAMLAEYAEHLQRLHDRRTMWRSRPVGDWDDEARAGYAEHLHRRILDAGWSGWVLFEKPDTNSPRGAHWVVSLGNGQELGPHRVKSFIGVEFPPDNIHPDWLLRVLVRIDSPGEPYNRHDCGLTPINDRKGFSSKHSPVAIIGLIDTIPNTPEGRAATAGQLDEMVDAAIGEYQAWCDRNRPSDGGER